LSEWRDGRHRDAADSEILSAASLEGRVLVTYDVSTIPTLLYEMALAGEDHAGVIFVSVKTVRQDDIGGLANALERLGETLQKDTTNLVAFLAR
jgi:predicted nuclease of predicted toxin-antitoxin system